MYLNSWREQTTEGKGRAKQSKHRVPALHNVLVNIQLLLVAASNYKAKVFIFIHHINLLTIECPGFSILVKGHVKFGAGYYNFGFISIKTELISPCIMADDVQGSLETTGASRHKVGVICYTDCSDAQASKVETKLGDVQREESRINVHFEVPNGSHVSLPIPLVFHDLPTQLVLQLHMALGVHVSVLAVVQYVTLLTNRVKFSELNFSLYRGKGRLTV